MRFSQIQGLAPETARALTGMVDSGHIPHALMFHEDDGGGGVSIALAFVQYLMCQSRHDRDSCGECPECNRVSKLIHPDLHFLYPVTGGTLVEDYLPRWRELVSADPAFSAARFREALGMEGKSPIIAVPQVKALLEKLNFSALQGGYRCIVIYLPELMNADAGNRLLKLIEEPPAMTQFILVTQAPERVLVTIRSRCQCLRILPVHFAVAQGSAPTESQLQNREMTDRMMEALRDRNLGALLELSEELAALGSRERQKGFCIFASEVFRRLFLISQGMEQLAAVPQNEKDKYSAWASECRASFPRKGLEAVSRAVRLIDRNVASKILFTDLADRLFVSF